MGTKFTEKAENALSRAVKIAEAFGHTYVGSEHILLALSEDEGCCASSLLKKRKIESEKLDLAIRKTTGCGHKTKLSSADTTPRSRRILESSYRIAKRYSADKIGTEHILFAILEEGESVAEKILLSIGVDVSVLRDDVLVFIKTSSIISEISNGNKETGIQNLLKYGVNMTKCAEMDEYDPVVGRDKETDRLIRILTRKNKNNPCLIGDAGVGKTAIVEGLAKRIADGAVPPQLKGKILISLDLPSMVAGAKYRGDFEDRIKNVLNEASKNKSVILFIDEIHSIVGAGSAEGAIDAANIMKPQLSRGDIRVIGATTISEYRKYIEKDSALERRFQPVMVEEPNESETIEILNGIKEKYERYYGAVICDEAIESAVRLAKRYMHERHFPDKAIDLIDEACAKVVSESSNCRLFEKTEYNFEQNSTNKTNKRTKHALVSAKDQLKKENKKCELAELPFQFSSAAYALSECDLSLASCSRPVVDERAVKNIISELYGLEMNRSDRTPIRLKNSLLSKIHGQNKAVTELVSSVTRNIVGITDDERPMGIFLFIGESGVGKTALAKALSYSLFENEDSLITVDMSEFSEPGSVSKIIGSAPGYIGYDDENTLLEKVRKHPYSVLLLDEIDKAHTDVLALFLQVFDNGELTDSSGRKINFRNCYVIMTSNYGASGLHSEIGFMKNSVSEMAYKSCTELFRPEFVNRIDAIIPFSPLDVEALSEIADEMLKKRSERLTDLGIKLEFQDGLSIHLGKITKKKGMGARPLSRLIVSTVDTSIAQLIASGEASAGDIIKITFNEQSGESGVKAAVCEASKVLSN